LNHSKQNILTVRANCFAQIRAYFAEQQVLEVDTPLLAEWSVTDPYMSAMQVSNWQEKRLGYLQTSPEYAMKKLLCHGSGDIFQLGKVFRADEKSPHHSDEFTMLEWYRLGYSESELMDEVHHLIRQISGVQQRVSYSYREVFQAFLGIDPFEILPADLAQFCQSQLGELPDRMLFDNYLTLLFATKIEPAFAADKVTFVYDFPASQASLAKTAKRSYGEVGLRFEAYAGGLELANGFNELTDANLQLARFEKDNQIRQALGYPLIEIDDELIEAMKKGLPQCAGVALGIDRLLMLLLNESDIRKVLPMSLLNQTSD